MLFAVAGIAIVLGFVGGLVSHAIFPQKAGPQGKQGLAGERGPAGPAGPTGSAGSLDVANLGYCVDVTYYTDDTDTENFTWVSGVTLSAPTIQAGTQSCRARDVPTDSADCVRAGIDDLSQNLCSLRAARC